ncbi:uncharacterized protein LOC116952486 isoform X2 [Petromyzon marinus]
MSDDGVLASGGELENAERAGKVLVAMLRLAVTLTIEDRAEPSFKRLSAVLSIGRPPTRGDRPSAGRKKRGGGGGGWRGSPFGVAPARAIEAAAPPDIVFPPG